MLLDVRTCCAAPGATGTFVELADSAPSISTGGVLIANVEPAPRCIDDAYHESAHCAVGFVLSIEIMSVTIDPPNPSVTFGATGDHFGNAVTSLAGHAGGLMAHRRQHREHPADVAETYYRVSECWPGFCDRCAAMRAAVRLAGFDEVRAIAIYRQAESTAWRLLGQHPVRRLIRATADRLMTEGTLSGSDFHAIADQIIDPSILEALRKIINLENRDA